MQRRSILKSVAGLAAGTIMAMAGPVFAQDKDPLRVAFGDIASVESLNLLIAMERTKERGVPMEMTFFNSEDVASQAVLGGEADIGVGAPYAFIQNAKAPIRMFYRMSSLLFFRW
jgi:NitT/TauT family transport system substrate-binding protein